MIRPGKYLFWLATKRPARELRDDDRYSHVVVFGRSGEPVAACCFRSGGTALSMHARKAAPGGSA